MSNTSDATRVSGGWLATLRRSAAEETPLKRGAVRVLRPVVPLLVPIALFLAWFLVTREGVTSPLIIPPPEDVFDTAVAIRSELLSGLWVSVQMVVTGFLVGGILGTLVGLLFGYSKVLRSLFEFTVDVIRPVPLFALIPLFILWFGVGRLPQIVLVALGVFLIMSLATIESVRNVDQVYVRAALTFGASRQQIYRTVVIPAIMPMMLSGLRYSVAWAWGLDVAAELIGSQEGLGYIMVVREQYLDTAGIVLIVIIFSALAIVGDRLMQRLALRLTRWTGRATDTGLIRDMVGGARSQ